MQIREDMDTSKQQEQLTNVSKYILRFSKMDVGRESKKGIGETLQREDNRRDWGATFSVD